MMMKTIDASKTAKAPAPKTTQNATKLTDAAAALDDEKAPNGIRKPKAMPNPTITATIAKIESVI